eukprot:958683-Alexandrium_andersonii.AAC.1
MPPPPRPVGGGNGHGGALPPRTPLQWPAHDPPRAHAPRRALWEPWSSKRLRPTDQQTREARPYEVSWQASAALEAHAAARLPSACRRR